MMTESEVASLVVGSRFVKCDYPGAVYTVTKLYLGVSVCFVGDNGDADEWPLAAMRAHCALYGAITSIRALYDRPERAQSVYRTDSYESFAQLTASWIRAACDGAYRHATEAEARSLPAFIMTIDRFVAEQAAAQRAAKAQREAMSAAIRVENCTMGTEECAEEWRRQWEENNARVLAALGQQAERLINTPRIEGTPIPTGHNATVWALEQALTEAKAIIARQAEEIDRLRGRAAAETLMSDNEWSCE